MSASKADRIHEELTEYLRRNKPLQSKILDVLENLSGAQLNRDTVESGELVTLLSEAPEHSRLSEVYEGLINKHDDQIHELWLELGVDGQEEFQHPHPLFKQLRLRGYLKDLIDR
jgi:hypothetical protein